MPKRDINYDNVFFYKIVCRDVSIHDLYVGSTTDFIRRKYKHKTDCINENSRNHHLKLYQFIRSHGNWENWDMVLIEKCSCDDGMDARKKERAYMEVLGATLNMNVPSRSFEEYISIYNENHKSARKTYYEEHKDEKKQHYETVRDERKKYYATHKDEKKQYNETRKEAKRIYDSTYRELNKEKLCKTYTCECGGKFHIGDKSKHLKTKKHITFLQNNLII